MYRKIRVLLRGIEFLFFLLICFGFSGSSALASTVTLSPTSGVAGQTVIITGSAFDNNSSATILWDDAALTTTPATVTTSASGAIPASGTVSFVVPSGMYGAHTVKISTGVSNVGVATFTINAPTIAITSPTIPTAGIANGVTLTVTATNMEAVKSTTFYFDDILVGTSTSTSGGVAELAFTIPDVQNTGTHILKAQQNSYAVASVTVLIAAPTITVAPTSGATGTKATITGTNFRANAPVSFFMNGADMNVDTSVTANGSGGFSVTFTVPNLSPGANTLKAQSGANLYATTSFTVSTPALTLSPAAGAGGMTVTAYGTGFLANEKVKFYINDDQLDETVTANNFGSFKKEIEIPGKFPTGAVTVRAQSDVDDSVNFATATYTITASAVTASPTAGVPGTEVTLSGTNFDPNETVVVRWNGSEIETSKKVLKTNSAGSFLTKIKIPSDYVSGNGQIEVYTSETSRVLITFTIANPTLTLSPVSGLPGSEVTVTGTNFSGRKELRLLWDDGTILTRPRKVMTTPLGGFIAVFTIPNSSRGVHTVLATTLGDKEKINITSTYTVTAPSITSSVTTGQANTDISLSGTGFSPNKPVKFSWDNGSTLLRSDPEAVIADGSGYFSAMISLPVSATPGNHIINAFSDSTVFTTFVFTVTSGSIVLSKDSGAPHTSVQVTGSGFDASQPVHFFWDNTPIETELIETDGIGGFATTLILPPSTSGMHAIRAETSEFFASTMDFGVDATVLNVNPSIGTSRGEVALSGMNFVSGRRIMISINDEEISTQGEAVVDGNGNFSTSIRLPFTFDDSVRITVRTGDEDRTIVSLPVSQWAIVTAIKNYGEWTVIVAFIIGVIFIAQKFGIPERGAAYARSVFAKVRRDSDQPLS